ncbi:DNA recombination protein RmuC [Lentisphaera profundi]|uniref:DNA recombination protein RmuC n=1 Tax=Lentisphaera profundi TaxID=1658616 RepID=A0ABY7VXB4_9BACT|nr:DNA recombination protein RmuC [Lentisphaera profundi]WDE98362.1 DNA recombination protein RmuC [Lentisphaera profundi]
MEIFLALIVGFFIGAILIFFTKKTKLEIPREFELELQKLRHENESLSQVKTQAKQTEQDLRTAQNQLSSAQSLLTEKQNLLNRVEEEAQQTTSDFQELLSANATLRTQLQADRRLHDEKLSTLKVSKEELTRNFKEIASQIFNEQNKNQSQANKEKLDLTLNPLKEQIQNFSKQVQDCYNKEAQERFSLEKEIKSLKELNTRMSEDALQLTNALKGDSKARGTWGELILERVLEASGLRKGSEYFTQVTETALDGKRYQPDAVVHLPDEKQIIIDSKVSLVAYEKHCSSTDEKERLNLRKAHLDSVKNHIKELSEKSYENLPGINSLDYVLLFMPVEGAFRLAVEADEKLFLDAYKKNIMLVSPSTLLITLRTISKIWQFESQNKNTQAIVDKAEALYTKFVGYVDSFQKIGKGIEHAQKAYDSAEGQLMTGRGNLIRTCQSLEELGIKSKKAMAKEVLIKADIELDQAELLETSD